MNFRVPASIPSLPDLAAIREAARRIAPHVHRTPVVTSRTLDRMTGARLWFKCENLQRAGAFKIRGAANAVLSLSDEEAARGVVTHSSGNHGAALALAASLRGIPAWVVMPEDAPRVKRAAVEGYGATVVPCEPTAAAREEAAARVREETGAAMVHPYDDERVIAGQGTAALELLEQVAAAEAPGWRMGDGGTDGAGPPLDLVVVPVGGGGLAAGTAIAVAGAAPGVRVAGAEPAAADDAARSLAAGRRIPNPPGRVETLADGLKASLSERTFRALADGLSAIATVDEEAIAEAARTVWERMKLVVEPSAAVPVAALLAGALPLPERADGGPARVGVILSGGNADLDRLPWNRL